MPYRHQVAGKEDRDIKWECQTNSEEDSMAGAEGAKGWITEDEIREVTRPDLRVLRGGAIRGKSWSDIF